MDGGNCNKRGRIIFHIDVNSAFLSWEAVYRIKELGETLDLRTVPSAVGGDISMRRGVILAKSGPAKEYKIKTGEPVVDALRKCPNLVLVKPNHARYKKYSEAFMAILKNYTDIVEQYSIDEAFMDMSGTQMLFGNPYDAACRIKDEIYDTLGFTVNVGISSNKLLAKMASDFEKPNKVHTLFPEEIEKKMWHLPVRDLFSVGRSSEERLKSLGIKTIGDLAKADEKILQSVLKKHGKSIWNFANGIDDSDVQAMPADSKCYSNETTLSEDVRDAVIAKKAILSLTESVAVRLRRDGVRAEVISVSIRFSDLSFVSHQCVTEAPTNITNEMYDIACRLFDELWDGTPIRLLGVGAVKVSKDSGRQLSLFDDTDYEKLEKLDKAVDSIRERFGNGAIQRASSIRQ